MKRGMEQRIFSWKLKISVLHTVAGCGFDCAGLINTFKMK